jgi:hypothetical protein
LSIPHIFLRARVLLVAVGMEIYRYLLLTSPVLSRYLWSSSPPFSASVSKLGLAGVGMEKTLARLSVSCHSGFT